VKLNLNLTGLVLLGVVGLFFGFPLLAGAAGLVAMLWEASYLYGQRVSQAVEAQQVLSRGAVAPQETVEVTIQLTNPLPWPVPAVDWEDDFPDSFEILNEKRVSVSKRPHRIRFYSRFAMARHERVSRRVTIRASRRGRWVLGPVDMVIRDPLGLLSWPVERPAPAVLTVYPPLYPVPVELWRPALSQGERRGPPWNPPDPSRVIGVRPYEPGDPPRLVHPYATARTGSLQVKRLETEAEDVVELAVLVATAPQVWYGIEVDRLEALMSAVASAADLYLRQGAAVGLTLAGSVYGNPHGVSLPPARGAEQRDRMMTALAWAQPGGGVAQDLNRALVELRRRARPGAPVVVFTTFYDAVWDEAVSRLRQRTGRLSWVAVAFKGPRPALSRVPVYAWTPGGLKAAMS
jgi:uncharacterized protein (DUF58 family)